MRSYIWPLLLLLSACNPVTDIRDSRFIMGTLVEFTVVAEDQEQAAEAINAAATEMQRIEDMFTIYGEHDNSVKQLNRSAIGSPLRLPDEVNHLIKVSLSVQKQSMEAFNPALAKLNRLWGFSESLFPTTPPAERSIQRLIPPRLCFQMLGENNWIRLDERCQLDFGAIAKGYAIDMGINILRAHGIQNAIINAGGDIRLIGRHGARPWRVGIRHPRKQGEVVRALELEGDVAVVTSGDYERYYLHQGNRYHHILHPHTGMPANELQSATVIADNATLADAWSTALFINPRKLMPGFNYRYLTVDKKGVILDMLEVKDTP